MAGARPNPEFWRGKRVLLTGHTGFKGGWLAMWLKQLGAEVHAFSLAPEPGDALYDIAQVGADCAGGAMIDLRDRAGVAKFVRKAEPEIVLHLAAQPLVRRSILDPLTTYEANVVGTGNLLDALRGRPGLRAVLVITSDKVYANDGSGRAFQEDDALGGSDPYSASKAAAEVLTRSFAKTYFDQSGVPVATARGGNVIGGGDFAEDRLGPDCVRAALAERAVVLRHPKATRPWQHVLDCLCGYLLYAEALHRLEAPRSLNIGPLADNELPVLAFAESLLDALEAKVGVEIQEIPGSVEAPRLALDASLARRSLDWTDTLVGRDAITATARWYAAWRRGEDMAAVTRADIAAYQAGRTATPPKCAPTVRASRSGRNGAGPAPTPRA